MKYLQKLIYPVLSLLLLSSCSKDDHPQYEYRFVHIMENDASSVTVSDKANTVGTYNIYLSAPQFLEPVTVTYKVKIGEGLTEGTDYELLNNDTKLTFLPGIYDMPVRIRWKAHAVDPSKNNSIEIELVSADNPAFTIGLPGPGKLQRSLTITKVP